MYTTEIDDLISCPKIVTAKPSKQMKPDPKSTYTLRNDFSCRSVDGAKQFDIFMRMNTVIPYLFSIGLKYRSESGSIILCRYNGKHSHRNKVADRKSFDDFHIHKLYDQQLSDNTTEMLDAAPTQRYITFNEALFAFLEDCNIQDWRTYFPDLENQINQLTIEGV